LIQKSTPIQIVIQIPIMLNRHPSMTSGIPTLSKIAALMAVEIGLIVGTQDACKWLDAKGWILSGQPYDRDKLARVLLTSFSLDPQNASRGGNCHPR
jgi:hypothetical protein